MSAAHKCRTSLYNARTLGPRTPNRAMIRTICTFFTLLSLGLASSAWAQGMPMPAPPVIGAKSYLVIDAATGHEVAIHQADVKLAPASLTKLMSAYVVFTALEEGRIALDDEVTVSEKAWRTQGSRMFIEVGSKVSVEELLLGMIVQSGNDASVALAEHVGGTEAVFAEMMNQYAQSLGMLSIVGTAARP